MRCGQRHGAPVRSARPPPAECEYDEVWTCERGLSVLPVTTGHPPHVFQMRINQQEGVLVADDEAEHSGSRPRSSSASGVVDPGRLPPKVHAVISARLSQLSASARQTVSLAATIG